MKSAALVILGAAGLLASRSAEADSCSLLTYTFQPDCFRPAGSLGCTFDPTHPDFGPQIAVWVTSADGSRFVDTLMATNAVAIHGIGNRPGTWNFPSGPRFPYGRRQMALPIWAHARGELYPLVFMNDGNDDDLASHADVSSPEPYFCRPMLDSEIVDAITCPSGQFRSAKGVLDASQPQSYYPPRADLFDFGGAPCMRLIQYPGSCSPGDSAQYFALNDVDTVAAATPPYGSPFTGSWVIPSDLPAGDYALSVEVGKEFDGNAANQHPSEVSAVDQQYYAGYGQDGNVGQPSVLFQVPFTVGPGMVGTGAATATMAGYGDWSGATGDLMAPDATIAGDPGSGEGRLLLFDGPTGPAKVSVSIGACPSVDCSSNPVPVPLPVSFTATAAASGTGAALTVLQASGTGGQAVLAYEARYTILGNMATIDPSSFPAWTPAGSLAVGAAGSEVTVQIDGLTPLSYYALGVRATGVCGPSAITFQRFRTPAQKFTQLSGCFIATAAFGSDLAPEIRGLRTLRDAATTRSPLAKAAVDLYYRASPPLAEALRRSATARALIRAALRPLTR
ncbi:MAG TPA: CFI-box-CTERM domain-containing protein [Polyangia bacterium]|nr:CFI-box-CTERM domain-containing protein [Polyangia bacterium]